MNQEDIQNALDDAKNLLDGIYYHLEATGEKPWSRNALTTIDLILIELMKEIGSEQS